jgi:hypothetical protein
MRKLLGVVIMAGVSSALLAAVGCYQAVSNNSGNSRPHVDAPFTLPKPGPQQIVVDARLTYSAEENRPAVDSIVERARSLETEGGDSLEKLVKRWPDVTLDLLRNSVAAESDYQIRYAIAQSYDHAFGTADPAAGWYLALSISGSQRDQYTRFREGRQEFLKLLQSGQFADAANVDLAGELPADSPWALRAEALRLRGVAYLLDEKPDRAAGVLAGAVAAAAKGPTHLQFEVGLLLCEAQRRHGLVSLAAATWKSATQHAAAGNVRDPSLWERAILGKPGEVEWPAVGPITGSDVASIEGLSPPDTGDVLIAIGKMRFSRRAFQPALLAFSRAEAETTVRSKQDLSRLYRAEALVALQQPASALPVLDILIQSGDSRVAQRAKAAQGDLLCRVLDDRRHGIPLLREALADRSSDFPGSSQLTANLGLYCILEGLDEEGFRRLHEAEARFETEGRSEELAEALKNEAACLRFDKKQSEADVVQNRADSLCRKYGLAIGPLTTTTDLNGTAANLPKQ